MSNTIEEILPKKAKTKKNLVFISIFLSFAFIFCLFVRPAKISRTLGVSKEKIAYEATFLNKEDQNPQGVVFNPLIVENNSFPEVSARNAFFVNLTNDEIVFSKDSKQKVPIASLVKIMTAVVAVEHVKLVSGFPVSQKAATTGENAMGISEGEIYTLEELLYGLVLNSGNDSAVAIAEGVAGDEENFVSWMNTKAQELGLLDTKFSDASGLNANEKEYYSTAYDLAVLTEYALNKPVLAKIFSTFEYEIPWSGKHKYLYLQNQTNLLTTYPGVKGVKTGYTEEAGLCLVTYSENGGQKILGVILGSQDRKGDAIILLNYSFDKFGFPVNYPI